MAIKPLQMPDLSQLPDPNKDLFGGMGMTNPTSLMTMSNTQVNDLLNPKAQQDALIKPSAEAAKILQQTQAEQQAQVAEVDKLQQQQLRMAEEKRKQEQAEYEANIKQAARLRVEQEKARAEKAKEQGGKAGANPDGSFASTAWAEKLLADSKWNNIVSNIQRNDEMENWLSTEVTKALREEMGISDENVIKAELDNARKIISRHTQDYESKMRSDWIDPLDVVTSAGKAARTLYRGAGILFGASEDWAKEEKQNIDGINQTYSDKILLDTANYQYQRSKSKARNPDEGLVGGFVSGVKDAWDADAIVSSIVDTSGYVPYAVVGTALGAKALAAGAAATGLTGTGTAIANSLGGGLLSRGAGMVLNTSSASAGGVGGILAATDAAGGAFDSVISLDFNDQKTLNEVRANYERVYGKGNWQSLVDSHNGDMQQVKQELATQAGREAGGTAFITTAPLGFLSLEAALVRGAAQGFASGVRNRVLTVGANMVEETLEEGFTQLAQNKGANPVTGVDLLDDVGAAGAMGAIAGGGMSAGTQVATAFTDYRNRPTFDATQIDPDKWASYGNINIDDYRRSVGQQMVNIANDGRRIRVGESSIRDLQQEAFNSYVDNDAIWSRMTPEQQTEFKTYLQEDYRINTNGYAQYSETVETAAWNSGNLDRVKSVIREDNSNADLLNAFRVKTGVELNEVPKGSQAYYQTLANVMDSMNEQETNVSTRERAVQLANVLTSQVTNNTNLTDIQKKSVDLFMRNYTGANSARMTDGQQAQHDRVQAAAAQARQNQGTQNGTQQQTNQGQPSGQTTTDDNGSPVATQGGTTGTTGSTGTSDQTTQLAADEQTGTGNGNAQSVGDGATRQDPNTSTQGDATTGSADTTTGGGTVAGQTTNTGDTQATTTPTNVGGQITQQGIAGQTSQSGQSLGQAQPSPTQATTGGGSVGTPQTERNTNGRSNQAPTKASIEKSLFENGADISDTDIRLIVNDLPSNLKKSLAYSELRDNITIPSDKALSDYSVAQALAVLSNAQFNETFVPALGAKSMRTGRGKTIRGTYNAIIKSYANLLYDRQVAQYRTEQDARRQPEREQNAQARAEEQARIQQERTEQKAETDRIKAEQKAQREAEKEQARLDKQAERERQAQEKAQAREQKKIDDADVANSKAQQVLRDKQEILREKELVRIELTDSRAELVSQLDDAKLTQKESKETVREYEKLVKKANTAVDKADEAWRKELEKAKRKELKEQWTVEKNAATTTKNELTKAIKALEVADKSVNDLNKKIKALDVKIKKAKQAVTVANREVVSARTAADKTQAKLDALRGVQTDDQSTTDTNTDNGSQDVGETNVADIAESQVQQELNPNLPAVADQPQRNKRMRIEMTSTGLPTILMGMESTGLPTIELGYTIYLDYIPEQHKAEVRQDLMSDIPNDADIVGIIRELADLVGVTYDTMLDKLATNADNLNQNEYDGLASLLDTILIDLYGETNEQTNSGTNSQGTETIGETQRSEQGTARQTQRNAEPTTLPAVLGFRSLEVASRELTPLINTSVADLTLSEFTDLVNTISQATNLPTDVVVDNLANSQLLLEQPQGNILDFVYDGINNVWVWASEYNPPQRGQLNATQQTEIGYEQTPSREQGNRSLNAPNRAGTPALAEPAERVQEPIQLGTTQTGLGTIELGFNNPTEQEQTNATQNDLGQSVQPTQERTQDDNEVIRERTSNEPTNDRQGEVLGQSGQSIGGQSQESGTETTQDTNELVADTPKKKRTSKKDNAVTQQINEAVEKEHLQKEFNLINDYHNSLPLSKQEDTVEQFIEKIGYALVLEQSTTWQQAEADAQAKLKAEREARWAKLREQEAQGIYEDDFDISENPSAIQSDIDAFTSEHGIRSGGRMGSQTGAVELEFLLALPIAVYRAAKAIWNAIKKNVAAISMALAITTGTTLAIPTEADAATPTETAVVQNIVEQNDNQGKQFIVADKQAGTLTLYTPQGQQITSTPALFGKATGDSISTNNATPSGRYDLSYETNINNHAYGNSAQVLKVNGRLQENNAGNVAIHRVLKGREGRLTSETVADNRISYGCINIPASFYDNHLDREQDTVVYVLPETDAGRTDVFAGVSAVDTTVAEAKVTPQMDNANTPQGVVVTAEQIQNATPATEVKTAPAVAAAPLKIANTTPSTQVAVVAPVVVGGVTASEVVVPFDTTTPAEMMANGVFDTQPVSGEIRSSRTSGGWNIFELAAWLAGAGIVAKAGRGSLARRRKKLESKKAQQAQTENTSAEQDAVDNGLKADHPTQEQADSVVQENHNDVAKENKASGTTHVPVNLTAPSQKTPLSDAVSRAMWLAYLQQSSMVAEKDVSGNLVENGMVLNVFDNLDIMAELIDDALSDKTYEQATDGTFSESRKWRFTDPTDGSRRGVSAKLMNFMAGATQTFDNLMTKHGIARAGHEADSSLPSVHLAQVRAKSSGAYAQMHKVFIKPFIKKVDNLAVELHKGVEEVETDVGRLSTVRHVLNEGAEALWNGKQQLVVEYQQMLDNVNATIASTPDGSSIRPSLTRDATLLSDKINDLQTELDNGRAMYEGRTPWDGETKLPGGYTKARAEQVLADLTTKYGNDFSKADALAKETATVVHGIRQFATASGVFSNSDLAMFNDMGFTEYVPLYAEQKDPLARDESANETHTSFMDRLTADIPLQQARSLGLTKDLSRYHREGSTSPAADGVTNMKVFAMNMAGRIGSKQWENTLQQLYEGNVGKPYSTIAQMTDEQLAELNNSADSGKLPGLVRVRPGQVDYLPSSIQDAIGRGGIKPIVAKGFNSRGELVTFHYYFTEPTIQNEVYATTDLTENLRNIVTREAATLTRTAARLMTTYKPIWNAYNYFRDSFERISVMLMRPVKDKNGNLVNRWDLSKAYFSNLAKLSASNKAQQEIYRFLVLGEVKTSLQAKLFEAVGNGSINLITSQTEKHSVMADLKKSQIEKLQEHSTKMLGEAFNLAGVGKAKQLGEQALDFYVMRLTEVPQVVTALASYMAYEQVGVNKVETANRVRDQYDPLRANNKVLNGMSTWFPFVRSTFSGHYNLQRSLSEYWGAGEWQFTAFYILGGVIGMMAILSAMAGLFGDDEDGVPKLARLPVGTLMAGLPVPIGDDGVWSIPVGFGMNKLLWGISVNLWRQSNGYQDGADTATSIAGIVLDNTSPVQVTSAKVMQENPVAAVALSFTPTIFKPLMDLGFNVNSVFGSPIITTDTPKDQYRHKQDNFNTPESYKRGAEWFFNASGGMLDIRPEALKYLTEQYAWGPWGAVPKSMLADKDEKTLGSQTTKGEHFGALATALGADMAIQPNALNMASHTYKMAELQNELHKRYGVGSTNNDADWEVFGERNKKGNIIKRGERLNIIRRRLAAQNAPENVIDYIINGLQFTEARQDAKKDAEELAREYYTLRQSGSDDPELKRAVQDAYERLDEINSNYVEENNRAYFDLLQSH